MTDLYLDAETSRRFFAFEVYPRVADMKSDILSITHHLKHKQSDAFFTPFLLSTLRVFLPDDKFLNSAFLSEDLLKKIWIYFRALNRFLNAGPASGISAGEIFGLLLTVQADSVLVEKKQEQSNASPS